MTPPTTPPQIPTTPPPKREDQNMMAEPMPAPVPAAPAMSFPLPPNALTAHSTETAVAIAPALYHPRFDDATQKYVDDVPYRYVFEKNPAGYMCGCGSHTVFTTRERLMSHTKTNIHTQWVHLLNQEHQNQNPNIEIMQLRQELNHAKAQITRLDNHNSALKTALNDLQKRSRKREDEMLNEIHHYKHLLTTNNISFCAPTESVNLLDIDM